MEVPSESFTTENLGFKNLLSFASHKSWLLTDDFLKGIWNGDLFYKLIFLYEKPTHRINEGEPLLNIWDLQ